MNSETVPIDIILVLSALAGAAGAVITAVLGWLESRRRKQDRLSALAGQKLRAWLKDPTTPRDLTAREALAEVEKL